MSPPNQGYKFKASLTAAATDGTGVLVAACGASRGGGFQLSGTFSATVQFEQSLDGGSTWIAKTVYSATAGAPVTSATGTGQWKFACGGETHVRVRCSAYVSGTIVVDANFTAGLDQAVVGGGASGSNPVSVSSSTAYETVAASQTDQVMGATGAVGDSLAGVLIVPGTTSPGPVSIKDGNGSAITIFTGGATSVADLKPFFVQIGAKCVAATTPGWKITTGANVTAIGVGVFT